MLELPEAAVIAGQIERALRGKRIARVAAAQSPHKFAWYTGDPADYPAKLTGRTIDGAAGVGGMVEVRAGEWVVETTTNLRYYPPGEPLPPKHQLLLEFDDCSALVATVQMWGGMMCHRPDEPSGLIDGDAARQCPSPLSAAFDRAYFDSLFNEGTPKLSAKAFLATEQRIPGLGNGVLQDILWTAKIHPKRKMGTLAPAEVDAMFDAVKDVLRIMTELGGRDTENDLFGRPGGYVTILSKNTAGQPCPECESTIRKEAYMGGSVYYCPGCQRE